MLDLASQLGKDDLLLALISGGGSSLLAAPVSGVTLKELRQVTKALLHAGAGIHSINTVRKHLTRLSGGRLAQAANGAQGLALIISDVVGDDPTHIASGPCAPDPTTCADALEQLERFRITLPAGVKHHLETCAKERLLRLRDSRRRPLQVLSGHTLTHPNLATPALPAWKIASSRVRTAVCKPQ